MAQGNYGNIHIQDNGGFDSTLLVFYTENSSYM